MSTTPKPKMQNSSSSTAKVTLKLLIDNKTNKVLYGEAGKDFVDFLFTILSLPLATATKLLSKKDMVGSIGNLYQSVEDLTDTYIQPNNTKNRVHNPYILYSPINTTHLFSTHGLTQNVKLYKCPPSYHNCTTVVADDPQVVCTRCKLAMNHEVQFVNSASKTADGFVKDAATYMIMDNLEVKPMSTMSIMVLFNKLNIKDVGTLEEKVIPITLAEGLSLLKASLKTESVLTTVFIEEPSGMKSSSKKRRGSTK